MAFRVNTTARAKRDLHAILDWLTSQEAGDAGLRWLQGMSEAMTSLSEFPHRCPAAPENEILSFEVRQLLYGNKPHVYRVLFTIEADVVTVLHIRHGRRPPLTLLRTET